MEIKPILVADITKIRTALPKDCYGPIHTEQVGAELDVESTSILVGFSGTYQRQTDVSVFCLSLPAAKQLVDQISSEIQAYLNYSPNETLETE